MRNIFAGLRLRSLRPANDRPIREARCKNFIAAKQEKPRRSTTDLVTAVDASIAQAFTRGSDVPLEQRFPDIMLPPDPAESDKK